MNIGLLIRCAVLEGNFLVSELLSELRFRDDIEYAATNGNVVFVNKENISKLSVSDQYSILCHEARHILYKHNEIAKKMNLDVSLYNIATDIIINEEIKAAGRKMTLGLTRQSLNPPIPGNLKTSIDIYNWLVDNRENLDSNVIGASNDMIESEEEQSEGIRVAIEVELEKTYSLEAKSTKEIIVEETNSKLSIWDYITKEAGRLTQPIWIRNFRRESRHVDGCVMPNYRGYQRVPKVKVFIDASGSMGEAVVNILSSLKNIFKEGKMFKARYFLFDTKIKEYEEGIEDRFYGGTDLNLVANSLDDADLYVVITDCEGDMCGLNESKKNIIVFTNNMSAVKGKAIGVDNDFCNIIG